VTPPAADDHTEAAIYGRPDISVWIIIRISVPAIVVSVSVVGIISVRIVRISVVGIIAVAIVVGVIKAETESIIPIAPTTIITTPAVVAAAITAAVITAPTVV
jgi:hypothetical protein